jgi:hypothetical protein
MTEHPLGGGNVAAGIVRVGDTVRKPAGYWTPAVEALLSHLWRRGFTGAPRPLGRDVEGRQVLEYVPGPCGEGVSVYGLTGRRACRTSSHRAVCGTGWGKVGVSRRSPCGTWRRLLRR